MSGQGTKDYGAKVRTLYAAAVVDLTALPYAIYDTRSPLYILSMGRRPIVPNAHATI